MVEWMDRGLQRKLLQEMAKTFPRPENLHLLQRDEDQYLEIAQNLIYLEGHGLCASVCGEEAKKTGTLDGIAFKITPKGLDFLQDDGGLSAILNVVTVRFEADTLRALIAAKIDASSEPKEKKAEAKKRLLGLKEEGLKAAVGKVVELGLGNIPTAASWFLSIT